MPMMTMRTMPIAMLPTGMRPAETRATRGTKG